MRSIKLLYIYLFFFPILSFAQPGAADPQFGIEGWAIYRDNEPDVTNVGFYHMAIQPDGKMVVHRERYLARFTKEGQLDPTFGNAGLVRLNAGIRDMLVQADGNILTVAGNSIYKFMGTNGALDETWGNEGHVDIELLAVQLSYFSIALDTRGRIIVAGQATFGTAPNITKTTSVARLNADGSLDTEFNGTGIKNQIFLDDITRGAVECGVDGSDKIVVAVDVGGPFETIDIILKYNTDGKLDLSFGGGDGELLTDAKIKRLAVDVSGKIAYTNTLVDQFQFFLKAYLLTPDGTHLASPTLHQYLGLTALEFQDDGKLIIAGYKNGILIVMRLNTNGSFDQSFSNDQGIVEFIPGGKLHPNEMIYYNRRLFIAGLYDGVFGASEIVFAADGFILALDATDKRLKCNNFTGSDLQPTADPGKCYKTINNSRFDPVFVPSTATGTVQYQIKRNDVVIEQGTGSVNGKDFQVGQTQVVYTFTDITSHSCTFTVNVSDKEVPIVKAKNITVQLNSSGNASVTAAEVDDGSTDPCGIKSLTLSNTSFDCSNVGANTLKFTATDNSNNTSTSTAIVTIEDKVAPVAKSKNINIELDANGNTSITTAQIDDGSSDACGIKNLSLSKTTFDCSNKGNNQVTLTVTDNNNNSSTSTATVTVTDNISPSILSITPNPAFLWPADRKMKSITIGASIWDNCPGTTYKITNVVVKAGEFAGDNIGPDWEITGDHTLNLRAEISKKGVKRIYTVTVTCTDAAGNSSTASIDVIVAHNITSPTSGATVKVGSAVNLSGEFWDIAGKKHTAKWQIDDKIINGTLTEPAGMNNGTVTGAYKFSNAGVYKLKMNVTDQNGIISYSNTNENLDAIIVVYDPNGGYTYGGGNFISPAGALKSNPTAIGDASYGFAMNYFKNSTYPKGETQFEFKVGDFEFNALNFDYLAISNSMAQFKGTGKIIGGQSGIGFIMTVTDGQLDGTGVDKIRMRIYNKNNGSIIYDNQPGASDAALPVQAVGANSIVVISGNNSNLTTANTNQKGEMEAKVPEVLNGLEVNAFPNPSNTDFTLTIRTNNPKDKIIMQVIDMYGRVIEARNVSANPIAIGSMIRFGERYRPGTYFVRIIQGKEHKEIKLIKLSE